MSSVILRGRVTDANDFRRTAPDVMDTAGAAKYLGVSERFLHENASKLGIPFKDIARNRLFSRRRLIEWVESATTPCKNDVE